MEAGALAAAILALAAPAHAQEALIQDDEALVYAAPEVRDLALTEMRRAGFTHVRINVLHVRGTDPLTDEWGAHEGGGPFGLTNHADIDAYDRAVDSIQAAGLTPQLTLVWYGTRNAGEIAAWAGQIAEHFRGRVGRFSILNEPDFTLHSEGECDPATVKRLIQDGSLQTRRERHWQYRRVRRGRNGIHRAVVRTNGHKRVVYGSFKRRVTRSSTGSRKTSWRRVRRGKGTHRRVKAHRTVAVTDTSSRYDEHLTPRSACVSVMRGRAYRRIVHQAAPAIRHAAPDALILAGETSPQTGVLAFIREANRGTRLPVDGWAHHPYLGFEGGLQRLQAVHDVADLPVYLTEFGVRHDHPDRPAVLEQAWRDCRASGARSCSQYQFYAPARGRWNTSVAEPGIDTPEIQAIRRAIP